jgi:HK97 gp10 family phage protein
MDIKEFESILKKMPNLVNKAASLSLKQAALETESRLFSIFQTEGRSEQIDWPNLKEKYLQWKIAKGFSEKKLHKTATLAQSFYSSVNEDEALIGTPVKYAVFHEKGTKKMSQRPFMEPVFKTMSKKLSDIFTNNLKNMLNV